MCKLISARFHNVSEETLWQDCGMCGIILYVVWYGSVILYLFVKSVQLQLMFFLADYGIVDRMEEQKYSRKFLKEGVQRLTNEVIRLSDAVEPISAKCTRLKNRNDQLMKDNVDLYGQYQTSMRTLGFLNTTISTFLMNKSQDDFKQWSVVLEIETRRANDEEADRLNMLRDSIVS
jgi:hypothetical protein